MTLGTQDIFVRLGFRVIMKSTWAAGDLFPGGRVAAMPFKHAHLYVLGLFPLVGFAFWRGYFSDLVGAPFALHAHGVTASLWIGLLAFQSWSIHAHRAPLHRAAGLSVFFVLPMFCAGGMLVMQSMAAKFAAQADPFNGTFGARLGIVDAIATIAVPGFVLAALANRRQVHLHAGYMLATVLLVLSPIVARIVPAVPGFPMEGAAGRHPFEVAFHVAQVIAIGAALGLAARSRQGMPFVVAAVTIALQSLAFETVGRSEAWAGSFTSLTQLPSGLVAAAAIAAATVALRAGWGRSHAQGKPVAAR